MVAWCNSLLDGVVVGLDSNDLSTRSPIYVVNTISTGTYITTLHTWKYKYQYFLDSVSLLRRLVDNSDFEILRLRLKSCDIKVAFGIQFLIQK